MKIEKAICEVFKKDDADIEMYQLTLKTPMTTKVITLSADFTRQIVYGDIVNSGAWEFIKTAEEVKEIHEILKQNRLLKRDFSSFMNNIGKK